MGQKLSLPSPPQPHRLLEHALSSHDENHKHRDLGKVLEDLFSDDDSIDHLSACVSVTESILDFRTIHGRTYQVCRTTEYWQPNDDKQNGALDLGHHLFTLLLDHRLGLTPLLSECQHVLDVGTGTAAWAIDFADQHPSAKVMATDISPIQPALLPPNLEVIIDDAQEPWPFGHDTFDYIHMRGLYGSISDWQRLYEQAFHALRPGHYLEHFEIGISVHSAARASLAGSSSGSDESESEPDETTHIFDIWNAEIHEAADEWGRSLHTAEDGSMVRDFVAAGFFDVVEQRFEIPIGPWKSMSADDGKAEQVGRCATEFWDQSIEGFALFLLKQVQGWQHERIMELVAEMKAALRDESLKPYFKGTVVYGRKPES